MTTPTTDISARATGLPHQAIREVMELAWRRPDAIHLEVGEPGFPTPPHIVEAAARAARDGHTKYTPNAGIVPLREALAEKAGRVNGWPRSPPSPGRRSSWARCARPTGGCPPAGGARRVSGRSAGRTRRAPGARG
jgi:hypothetical protein